MTENDVTVRDWTRTEIQALRQARRMSVREFAAYLGVSTRIVSRWERADAPAHPGPVNQTVLDTSLRQADADTRERFVHLVAERRGRDGEGGER
ncbi:helix-turn-helix domain-containing protein [Haloechinothrix halophila]|uniref:helix-turn-helix domain-containing protein n=1 Tax=Haloechinothrix halophila TaxID=1069073 RepID=UPI0004012A0E|nr:helix-turn-helix domain-containing protein [Haloechinothrix halophila]